MIKRNKLKWKKKQRVPSSRHTVTPGRLTASVFPKLKLFSQTKKNNNKLMFLIVWWCKRGGPSCRLILKEAHLQKKNHAHSRTSVYLSLQTLMNPRTKDTCLQLMGKKRINN